MSPRGHYRDQLNATYCFKDPTDESGGNVSLCKLSGNSPVQLINTTANLPSSSARNLRDRGCYPFVFTKYGCYFPKKGEQDDEIVLSGISEGAVISEVDLATATAISGAAVSPLMGANSPAGVSPWLTLLNLRLGYWLPNPNSDSGSLWPTGFYLLREYFGLADEAGERINLSDGGHFENLGIYELIRRRCQTIIAIDGEADPEISCGGLMRLIQLARIDFGADIRIDVEKLRLSKGYSHAHFALGEIKYADNTIGRLLYIKLSVTGDEPNDVLRYRAREPAFPHQSTADQLFGEEQFEAYRALGEHIGEKLFVPELIGKDQVNSNTSTIDKFHRWIGSLDQSMLRKPRYGKWFLVMQKKTQPD